MLLHVPQQSLQILWDLNCKSFLVLPTQLLFPYLIGRRISPLKAGSSMSSTIMWCSPSSFCQAGEVSPGHGGWQALYGGTKVHLKWVGHELLEEDNLLWLAGQRPGQTSACAGCDKGEGELQKASCVPLPEPQLSGETKCIFPSSRTASSLGRAAATAVSPRGASHLAPAAVTGC